MLQQVKKDCGIMYKSIDREIGVDYPLTHKVSSLGVKSNYFGTIRKIIQNRGRMLSNFRARTTDDVENILTQCGMNHSFLARKLGINKAALRQRFIRGMTPEMLEEVEEVLRDIGLRLRRTVS